LPMMYMVYSYYRMYLLQFTDQPVPVER